MNHFERVAIFTLVENIEAQLRGLKTLIAASANQTPAATHKTTPTLDTDSMELSDEDEDKLQKQIESARKAELERMAQTAQAHFQQEWDLTARTMADLDG
jgi:hypothetical protein